MKYLALLLVLLYVKAVAQDCDTALSKDWPETGYRHAVRHMRIAGKPSKAYLEIQLTHSHMYFRPAYRADSDVLSFECATPLMSKYRFHFSSGKVMEYIVNRQPVADGEIIGNNTWPTLYCKGPCSVPKDNTLNERLMMNGLKECYWTVDGKRYEAGTFRGYYDTLLHFFRTGAMDSIAYATYTYEMHVVKKPTRFVYYLMYPKIKHDINRYRRIHTNGGLNIKGPYGKYILTIENAHYAEEYNIALQPEDAAWVMQQLNCFKP